MKYLSVAALLFLLGSGLSSCTGDNANAKVERVNAETPVAGFTSFEDAFARAKSGNKLVMVDVYTDWCGWCKRMDREVYSDAKVQAELAQYFTAAKLNAESTTIRTFQGGLLAEQQIASHWGVSAYPTIIFLDANGEIVQRVPGYIPATEFPYVLKFIGTRAFEQTTDYQSWKKTATL